jgi:DNA-binding response OmpR family regulator
MARVPERRRKVLVIDDDEQHLKLTERLLRQAGYEVLTRFESLGTCATVTAEDPDMVLIDLSMPSLDGDRLTPLIQRCTGVRPIVVLYSGMDPAAFEQRARACGADAMIQKGLLPAEFLQRVALAFTRGGDGSTP